MFYLDMVEESIILYEQGKFLTDILNKARQKIAQLGAKRARVGTYWYWDLMPDYKPGEVVIFD